jgi:hypothetical protein
MKSQFRPPGRDGSNRGGDRFRLWLSMWEKRAVVSGATLKSRNKKQTPSLSSRTPSKQRRRPSSLSPTGWFTGVI